MLKDVVICVHSLASPPFCRIVFRVSSVKLQFVFHRVKRKKRQNKNRCVVVLEVRASSCRSVTELIRRRPGWSRAAGATTGVHPVGRGSRSTTAVT